MPQAAVCEWHLLGASVTSILDAGGRAYLIAPPKQPHVGGLVQLGLTSDAWAVRPEVYDWITLPETFHARLELMSRVETAPALLLGARRLLLQMAGWLAARRLGTTAFTLRWCHDVMRAKDAGTGGELTIRTAHPTQHVEHFARLLAEHLAKVQLLALLVSMVDREGDEVPTKQRSFRHSRCWRPFESRFQD